MKSCFVCGAECFEIRNFGDLPICHHFFVSEPEGVHPLNLGQCPRCATVQCLTPIPPAKLTPRFDWISYNEPEAHLDAMVERLQGLPGITRNSVIAGVTYKEDTTLKRFRDKGFLNTWRLDPKEDLDIHHPNAGVELFQQRIQSNLVDRLAAKYPKPDILIVRHVLEHTHDTIGFMETFRKIVNPEGYVVFEVPDCARAFDMLDYTTLWEDHTIYFVESTFLHCLGRGGFSIHSFERYRAAYENCLVAIARPFLSGPRPGISSQTLAAELKQAAHFGNGFERRKQELRALLLKWRKQGKLAAFGAGHQLAMYINLMDVADLLEFVVDDHPRKSGMCMPGSRLRIVGSDNLLKENVSLCLLSLSAESEKKVVEKQRPFLQGGGSFASIFPVSEDSILNFIAGPNLPQ